MPPKWAAGARELPCGQRHRDQPERHERDPQRQPDALLDRQEERVEQQDTFADDVQRQRPALVPFWRGREPEATKRAAIDQQRDAEAGKKQRKQQREAV